MMALAIQRAIQGWARETSTVGDGSSDDHAVGSTSAHRLRPSVSPSTSETAQAMSGLLTLADVDRRDPRFTSDQFDNAIHARAVGTASS